jgi:hypothetical protein
MKTIKRENGEIKELGGERVKANKLGKALV